MVPTDWLAVLLFLVLVAPGMLFELLARRRRATLPESAFVLISRVILVSVAINVLVLLIFAVVQWHWPALVPDPAAMIRNGSDYVADNYRLVLVALLAQALLAASLVYLAHLILANGSGASTHTVSAWARVFRQERPKGHIASVRVKLTDGAVFAGHVSSYSSDHEIGDRELVLAPPLFSKAPGGGELQTLAETYKRLVLRGDAIVSVAVQYGANSKRSGEPARRIGRHHRVGQVIAAHHRSPDGRDDNHPELEGLAQPESQRPAHGTN